MSGISYDKKKLIGTTIIGNIVEYYDFGMYAVFAPIMGDLFFPQQNERMQLLLTFLIFAIGFFIRPIGGLVFGHIGDKYGRRVALRTSIIGMAVATIGIALLPPYETIGIWAPLLLVVIRLVQGLCIGGEGTGSAIYILEHLKSGKLSMVGSIVMSSNIIGTLLANVTGLLIIQLLGLDPITWRYGFALGALMGLVGAYFRHKNEESPVFQSLKNEKALKKIPLFDVLRRKKFAVVSLIITTGAVVSISYLIRGYLNAFFSEVMGYSEQEGMIYSIFALITLVLFLPISGYIADRLGYSNTMMFAAFGIALWATPLFSMISNPYHNKLEIYQGLFGLSLLTALIAAPLYPYAMRLFPPELRYSGVALGYNLGNAVFGGTTPLLCTLLVDKIDRYSPPLYLMVTSSLFIAMNIVMIIMINLIKKKQRSK
mgnify:CR=1 FL=1